ncbi:PAT complex subunit CCDC47 [Daktulosphaira vitifoliae]|uniref:PAT complex subunit CCDC47 n=1 Tax=Daktulosphaira vitifoliae TaxID=58002 RepID=UPI0021AA2EE5|nr:PAT complex subunit CCDC47 [Daktulosphaira vitifoliae]
MFFLKVNYFLVILFTILICYSYCKIEIEEVDEFEEFDDSPSFNSNNNDINNHENKEESYSADKIEPDVTIEDDDEFEHFNDEEEFEGFDTERIRVEDKDPKITIASVPVPFHTNWANYIMEILFIIGIIAYFANFFYGRSNNARLADIWFKTHKSLLDDNFSLVGDDGKIENESNGLIKETESTYTLWCSGRMCCEGMLVELQFIKRQDLASMANQFLRPSRDEIHVKVDMNKEDMDTFVFCVASKKTAARISKEMADLSVFCPERKPGANYGLTDGFSVHSELGEVSSTILDAKTVNYLNKYADVIDCLHFSDRYSGLKLTDDTNVPTKLPATKKVLLFTFTIPTDKYADPQDAINAVHPLMSFVFQCMERIKRLRISKEAKIKAEKNRLRVEEAFLKTTHAARAEAAAARKEEKRRLEKERILKEDPEKQRKWEEKELKRQQRKKAPRMKQLKVKSM